MRDHVYALTAAAQLLAEFWYLLAAALLLFFAVTRQALMTHRDQVLPTLRPLRWLFVWPLVGLLAGLTLTDVDQYSEFLTMGLMGIVAGLFVANLVHAIVQLVRQRTQWALLGSALLVQLELSLCVTVSSMLTISGIGRHWM